MSGATEAEGLELHTPEYERRIAETLADRRPSRQDVLERAARRERFVCSLVTGMGTVREEHQVGVSVAVVEFADQLLWALDRRRDAELQEARS